MLQEYLRAASTVSERCSGAVPSGSNAEGKNTRLNESVKQIKDFDNAWKIHEEWNKWEGEVKA